MNLCFEPHDFKGPNVLSCMSFELHGHKNRLAQGFTVYIHIITTCKILNINVLLATSSLN